MQTELTRSNDVINEPFHAAYEADCVYKGTLLYYRGDRYRPRKALEEEQTISVFFLAWRTEHRSLSPLVRLTLALNS